MPELIDGEDLREYIRMERDREHNIRCVAVGVTIFHQYVVRNRRHELGIYSHDMDVMLSPSYFQASTSQKEEEG